MKIFWTAFLTIFVAEMGDKTQLLLVALAGKYKIRDVLLGTWLATFLLNFLAVLVGVAFCTFLDLRIIKTLASCAFYFFSICALKDFFKTELDSEDEDGKNVRGKSAFLAIFTAFFLGELGDKTQLSAITLAASYVQENFLNLVLIFAACTLALIFADFIGFAVGLFLKQKIPKKFFAGFSALLFAFFGTESAFAAGKLIFCEKKLSIFFAVLFFVIFALTSFWVIFFAKKTLAKNACKKLK